MVLFHLLQVLMMDLMLIQWFYRNSILPFRLDELKREMMKGQLEKAKVLAEQAVSMMRETVLKKKQKEEQEGGAVSNTLISV